MWKKPAEFTPASRLSLTDTGKVAPKYIDVLKNYPLLDNLKDALLDRGVRADGRTPYTTNTIDRLKGWYSDLQSIIDSLIVYYNDKDPAVAMWVRELKNYIEQTLTPIYNVKYTLLHYDAQDKKTAKPAEKEALQERIRRIPIEEKSLDRDLKKLEDISELPKFERNN